MSDASDDDLALAAEFPTATRAQWLALVERVLKGAPLEKLTARTADGLAIEPLYARAPGGASVARPAHLAGDGARRSADPAAANAQALDELEGGATGWCWSAPARSGATLTGSRPRPIRSRVLDGVALDAGKSAIEFD